MLETRFISEDALAGAHGARLLRYLLDRGADEFSITVMALQETQAPFADAFEEELGPFERGIALRAVTEITEPPALRPVRLWLLNDESLHRLLSFFDDGLFHSPVGPDGWLEDLTVYRSGELILGLMSHHREGVLQLDPDEYAALTALGISTTPSLS